MLEGAVQEGVTTAAVSSGSGDMVQMVAVVVEDGYLIIHAMAPPTTKVLRELGMAR